MLNDMLNTHDKHLTKINLNKFSIWICPLVKEKFKYVLKKKKKLRLVKKNQICFWKVLKKRFYQEKSDLYCETEKELDFLKRIRSVLCKAKKKNDFDL